MNTLVEQSLEISFRLRKWFQTRDYKGIDPFQIDEKLFSYRRIPFLRQIRSLLKPFHARIPSGAFSRFQPVLMPKALGLIIAGNTSLYKIDADDEYIQENHLLNQHLKALRNRSYQHYCWGWPFEWGSEIRYPPGMPLVCVTSPIGHALLDFYSISNDVILLNQIEDVADYLLYENGYSDFGDSLCVYYSPNNRSLVHNSNLWAASYLIRLYQIIKEEQLLTFARKAINYCISRQNPDGSWYYHSEGGKIDNRHTGFVLESLAIANSYLNDGGIGQVLDKGWLYYRKNLFEGVVPRWSPDETYPVDIHDVAQSIITSIRFGDMDFAQQLVQFAVDNLFNGNDEFYYKLFQNRQVNKNVFFRWGQAWMYRALTLYCQMCNTGN